MNISRVLLGRLLGADWRDDAIDALLELAEGGGGKRAVPAKGACVCSLRQEREKEEKKLFFWMYIKSGYMLLFSPTLDWFENDGTSQLFITEIEWGEEEDVNRSGVAHEWRQDRSWQKANSLVPEGPIRLMAFLLSCWHITATRLREN